MKERTKVIVDDTTIYEVDLACYESLTPEEKRKYFPQTWEEESRMHQRNKFNESKIKNEAVIRPIFLRP